MSQWNCGSAYLEKNMPEVRGKVREDLMDTGFSSIWIELGTGDQKEIVGCTYLEHQFMKQNDQSSLTKEA